MMTLRKRRRKFPGGVCPKCGQVAFVTGVRYTDSRGNDRRVPLRRFTCGCGERFTFPATDLMAEQAPPNPPSP